METTYLDQSISLLSRKMQEAQSRNPRLSQRAFAQKMGLSSGALSEVLSGKRSLTHQMKLKLAPRLHLSPKEEVEFFQTDLTSSAGTAQMDYIELSNDQFHLISDWWHFALLNLINTKGFKPQLSWFMKRIGLSRDILSEAWDRLNRLGFAEKRSDGTFVKKFPQMSTTDGLLNLSIRKAHLEDLKLLEHSIIELPLDVRDHTSFTLTINRKDMKKAKELIRVFQDQFGQKMESVPGEEVYRLNIAFFPLTRVSGDHS